MSLKGVFFMSKTVLVVDDQSGIRLLLEEIIKNEGHHVKSCEHGSAAIACVKKIKPELIIMDYRLPLMDGCQVVEQLENEGIVIPTILMSGLVDEVKEKSKDLKSVKSYFSKPFNIHIVKDEINKLLDE